MEINKPNFDLSRRDFLKASGVGSAAALLRLPESISADVLDTRTQQAIARKAASLIRPTPEGANALSDSLNNFEFSSADIICGPLAAYQLIETVTYGVEPYDFWQADARKIDGRTDPFSQAFPADKFDTLNVKSPIIDFDFNSAYLQPGDFIYFMSKIRGWDHMVTVSRRDAGGTLWAVTNYPGEDKKFIIKEVPLWNPKNPDQSFVKELAKGDNPDNFSSGQGGFLLYRLKAGESSALNVFEQSVEAQNLRSDIKSIAKNAKGEWHVMIADVDSGKILAENLSRIPRHSASVIKVPMAMCLMSVLEDKYKSPQELQDFLNTNFLGGRTFNQLLGAMLVDSEEEATARLADYLISLKVDSKALLESWGIKNTMLSTRSSTEEDMWKIFTNLYDVGNNTALKFPFSHQYLLKFLSTYTVGDKERLGTLSADGVGVNKIYDKRGSIATNQMVVVADSGIIEAKTRPLFLWSRPYFVSINGTPRRGTECSYETLESEFLLFVQAFAKYLKG